MIPHIAGDVGNWSVWVHDYKICSHLDHDRAWECACALDDAIHAALAGKPIVTACPEVQAANARDGYRTVQVSEETLSALSRWKQLMTAVDEHASGDLWARLRHAAHEVCCALARELADVLRREEGKP